MIISALRLEVFLISDPLVYLNGGKKLKKHLNIMLIHVKITQEHYHEYHLYKVYNHGILMDYMKL